MLLGHMATSINDCSCFSWYVMRSKNLIDSRNFSTNTKSLLRRNALELTKAIWYTATVIGFICGCNLYFQWHNAFNRPFKSAFLLNSRLYVRHFSWSTLIKHVVSVEIVKVEMVTAKFCKIHISWSDCIRMVSIFLQWFPFSSNGIFQRSMYPLV